MNSEQFIGLNFSRFTFSCFSFTD